MEEVEEVEREIIEVATAAVVVADLIGEEEAGDVAVEATRSLII